MSVVAVKHKLELVAFNNNCCNTTVRNAVSRLCAIWKLTTVQGKPSRCRPVRHRDMRYTLLSLILVVTANVLEQSPASLDTCIVLLWKLN